MKQALAMRLARQLLELHTKSYNNDEADAHNTAFERLALELARAVVAKPVRAEKTPAALKCDECARSYGPHYRGPCNH